MQLDVLIFGGGAAGLWLLDELARRGAGLIARGRSAWAPVKRSPRKASFTADSNTRCRGR